MSGKYVDTPGLYQIKIEYYPVEGRASIERELWLNGELFLKPVS